MGAHHILMILLRRLAYPARWCDLNQILGGNTQQSSKAFNYALQWMFHVHVPMIQDLRRWSGHFAGFAKRLADCGAPFDNLVSFVDGHFDPTARPGGDACVSTNVWDFQVYNALHKDHGLMFQGLVLVNGFAMCWGPFGGNEADAKTIVQANIIEDLHSISGELGVTYSHFADSAYPQSRYMHAILKCPAGGQLSAIERRFNALMARFRIVIEQLFAEVDASFAFLQMKQNKRLGRQDVGKMFPVAVLLHNVRTHFYGNQCAGYFGLDGCLDLSLMQLFE
jgi:hypothetical protein